MMFVLELTKNQPSNAKIKRGLRRELPILEDSDFGIVNKKEINIMAFNNKKNTNKKSRNNNDNRNKKVSDYGSKKDVKLEAPEKYIEKVEYKMSQALADEIVGKTKGTKNPQETLCEYVNSQCGLKGYCVKVIVG